MAITKFDNEWKNYKKTRFARGVREWAPMCVGGLVSIPASLVNPLAGVVLAGVGFALTVVEKRWPADEGPYGQRKAFDLLCRLEKEILRKADVKKLI